MPFCSGSYEKEYDYERDTDFQDYEGQYQGFDNGEYDEQCNGEYDEQCNGEYDEQCNGEYDEQCNGEYEYGYGIDTDSFYLTRNGMNYDNYNEWLEEKHVESNGRISKRMSIYIPDLGFTPKYFKNDRREEINSYFVDYLTRVLCSPYHRIVKKVHKVHTEMNKKTDTVSCTVYVEWYDNIKSWLLQTDIKNKKQNISVKFSDGFEWKLRKNYKPIGDFTYEEKLRAEIERLKKD